MSRKTKAELRSLVAELEAENKALRRQLEIQAEQIRDLHDGTDWDQYKIKTTNNAFREAMEDSCDRINARNNVIEGYKRGPIERRKQAEKKKKYVVKRFNHWLSEGKRYDIARTLANDELKEKFKLKKGYGTTRLCEFCPKPEDQ